MLAISPWMHASSQVQNSMNWEFLHAMNTKLFVWFLGCPALKMCP